jgi:hypothetical protein
LAILGEHIENPPIADEPFERFEWPATNRLTDPAFLDTAPEWSIIADASQHHLRSAAIGDSNDFTSFGSIEVLGEMLLEFSDSDIDVSTLPEHVHTFDDYGHTDLSRTEGRRWASRSMVGR